MKKMMRADFPPLLPFRRSVAMQFLVVSSRIDNSDDNGADLCTEVKTWGRVPLLRYLYRDVCKQKEDHFKWACRRVDRDWLEAAYEAIWGRKPRGWFDPESVVRPGEVLLGKPKYPDRATFDDPALRDHPYFAVKTWSGRARPGDYLQVNLSGVVRTIVIVALP